MNAEAKRTSPGKLTAILGLTWVVAYWAARFTLENRGLATGVRVGAALLPVPIFAGFLWSFVRFVRAMDEFERKIHTEAVSIAFALTALLLTTLALMQRAVELNFEDWSYAHVWIYMPIFYLFSFIFVSRRYGVIEE